MPLTLLDGAGIKIIKRDETIFNVKLSLEFALGLLIENQQGLKQVVPSFFDEPIG